jgi:flagellar basal-body rod protein FlgG
MIKAMYTAAAGMQAQQSEVDVIANNLANVQTAGFKKSMTNFEDLLYVTMQDPGTKTASGTSVAGLQVGSGSRLVSTSKIFSPGVLVETRSDLDLAIRGDGFFEVQGAGGERLFTRDGHFFKDANGDLVTAAGLRLVPAINVPREAVQIEISPDGFVSYVLGDAFQQIGQISLVRFTNPAGLSSEGGNLFRATSNSGDPITVAPGTDQSGTLLQGYVERSNVDVAGELIALILAQRAFEVNSKAIRVSDEMLNTTNNLTR